MADKTIYSEYWLEGKLGSATTLIDDKILKLSEIKNKQKDVKLFYLANIRRTINKLVNILSGKTLNVQFSTKMETGATDGKNIYLSSDIHEGNMDSTVGLALHEATHCIITDFGIVTNIADPKVQTKLIPKAIYDKAGKIKYETKDVDQFMTILLNWVEDRRIDYWQFMNSPGYKGYYKALYKRFFFNDTARLGIESPKHRTEDPESYFFRIIHIINPARDLDALKGLRAIYDKIDLKNIKRLQSTNQALTVAIDIFDIMLDYILKHNDKEQQAKNKKPSEFGDGEKQKGHGADGSSDDDEFDIDPNAEIKVSMGEDGEGGTGKGIPWDKLSDKQKKSVEEQLKKLISEQKKFLENGIEKKNITDAEAKSIGIMSDPQTTINKVKMPNVSKYTANSHYDGQTYEVVVVRNINDAIFFDGNFTFSDRNDYYRKEFEEGENMGRILANKLRIRNEERELIYNRMTYGKIDKRRLASYVGYDASNVFQQRFVEKYCDSILHISIDVSGSMSGQKLGNAIMTTVAICKAASITANLDVIVSLRGTTNDSWSSQGLPMMAIIYDSRVDKYNKVQRFFPYLTCGGTTPEGLCFAAIQEEILSSTRKLNSYFCNLSDGAPYYTNYTGEAAAYQTMEEIRKMRLRGINILSYYIDESRYGDSESEKLFRIMYGQDAKFIDVRSIVDIAKTLNDLFLGEKK